LKEIDNMRSPSTRGVRLEIDHVNKLFGGFEALRPTTVDIEPGEFVSVVGPSGCGKSTLMLMVAGLLKISQGTIRVGGKPLSGPMTDVGIAFQDHLLLDFRTAFDNVLLPGIIRRIPMAPVRERTRELFDRLGLSGAADRYPHQLSGGMRQRVMIAMALACNPRLLIADEPTTALDVTIQAQILDLMRDLKTRLGSAIMLITHDLGVVAEMAERVIVMYAGRKVEEATVYEIFARPLHPYTRGLIGAVPKLGSSLQDGGRGRLAEIAGLVPSLRQRIVGCPFAGRCEWVTDLCREIAPAIELKTDGHWAACHYAERRLAA
jgi:peptide/nickel transport system ATP-binding protein